jgi:hypothetical protein
MIQRIKYHVMASVGANNSTVSLRAFNTKEEAEAFRDTQPAQAWIEIEQYEVPDEAASMLSFLKEDD